MNATTTSEVVSTLNKFFAMGFGLRDACGMTDRALGLKDGVSREVLVGRRS